MIERPSFLDKKSEKASIRSNNPGAMWPGPSSRKFHAIGSKGLNDGLGQGNKIAYFDDAIDGAAALFDLLDRGYSGRTVRAAITKWSGGNWVSSYLKVLDQQAGVKPDAPKLPRPDVDNVAKAVLDALQDVIGDDTSVARLVVEKSYGTEGRTTVRIS